VPVTHAREALYHDADRARGTRMACYRSPHGYSRDRAITKGGMTVANEGHGYNIEVGIVGGLNSGQQAAFKSAADRWSLIISADGPAAAKPSAPEWSL
jgi:hypothetical protein